MAQQQRCLDSETVRLLVAEELSAGELARVAAHLGTCHACRDVIVMAAAGPQEASGAAEAVSRRIAQALTRGAWVKPGEPTLGAGDVVGTKYRLISLIGEGGSSSVWRAERMDWRAPVALKLLVPPAQDSREFTARFEREVRLAAALRSPHVAQILDHGVDDRSGQPFIALELLEGETLDQRLKRSTRLSAAETAVILAQVGRALSRAHSAGVVHRDLKPANIFIARDSEQELVKVLDFGVAKSRTVQGDQSLVTTPGTVLGTPSYMSPEQIRGSTALDQHVDLWSLAVIACECLTGRKPFVGTRFLEVALSVLSESKRPIPSKLGPAPAGFDAWFGRATHPDRSQRFQSARRALDALVPICEAPSARAGETLGRLSKYAVFAAAVGLSLALGYRTVHLQTQSPATPPPSTADTLSVATTELAPAPKSLPRMDPASPKAAPPSIDPPSAVPETTPGAVPVDAPRIARLSPPKELPNLDARSPRKTPARPRADAPRARAARARSETPATARPQAEDPEQQPVSDGPRVRIDLSE